MSEIMSERYKKTCKYKNYVEHLLVLAFTHNTTYSASKDSAKGTISDKILKIEQLQNLAKSRKYDAYQRTLASMVYKFF